MKYNIAVIITCYNRKAKTLACLDRLFHAQEVQGNVELSVFLTDDGCTDGTADAVRTTFAGKDIHILQGNGQLYWAGGMLLAWKAAMSQSKEWDFYLLLNDDTFVMEGVFKELFSTHEHSLRTFGKAGIYSGVTCDPHDPHRITYGGGVYADAARCKIRELEPSGQPQLVERTNANILLVSRSVVEKVGIFYEGYFHSGPDIDYSIMVRKAGLPAWITAHVCGTCPFDHTSDADVCRALMKMSLKERMAYLQNPLHREHDHLVFVKRHNPEKYPITWLLQKLRLYAPSIYMLVNKARGLY